MTRPGTGPPEPTRQTMAARMLTGVPTSTKRTLADLRATHQPTRRRKPRLAQPPLKWFVLTARQTRTGPLAYGSRSTVARKIGNATLAGMLWKAVLAALCSGLRCLSPLGSKRRNLSNHLTAADRVSIKRENEPCKDETGISQKHCCNLSGCDSTGPGTQGGASLCPGLGCLSPLGSKRRNLSNHRTAADSDELRVLGGGAKNLPEGLSCHLHTYARTG